MIKNRYNNYNLIITFLIMLYLDKLYYNIYNTHLEILIIEIIYPNLGKIIS